MAILQSYTTASLILENSSAKAILPFSLYLEGRDRDFQHHPYGNDFSEYSFPINRLAKFTRGALTVLRKTGYPLQPTITGILSRFLGFFCIREAVLKP